MERKGRKIARIACFGVIFCWCSATFCRESKRIKPMATNTQKIVTPAASCQPGRLQEGTACPKSIKSYKNIIFDITGVLTHSAGGSWGREREMTDLLHQLKQAGYKIYILSNYLLELSQEEYAHDRKKYAFFDLCDGMLFSWEAKGAKKPNSVAYQTLLEKYNLKHEECFFIDDTPRHVNGAKACGIDGIVYHSYQQLKGDFKAFGILNF